MNKIRLYKNNMKRINRNQKIYMYLYRYVIIHFKIVGNNFESKHLNKILLVLLLFAFCVDASSGERRILLCASLSLSLFLLFLLNVINSTHKVNDKNADFLPLSMCLLF